MAKLTDDEQRILEQLQNAQAEREAVPLSERIPISNPDKYAFPIGISDEPAPDVPSRDDSLSEIAIPYSIHARYHPGFSDRTGWGLSIERDGTAVYTISAYQGSRAKIVQEPGDQPERSMQFRLKQRELTELAEMIDVMRFFELRDDYSAVITDADSCVLNVESSRQRKTVKVYGIHAIKGDPGIDRFIAIWNIIIRILPLAS
jgi:hypothetical protein